MNSLRTFIAFHLALCLAAQPTAAAMRDTRYTGRATCPFLSCLEDGYVPYSGTPPAFSDQALAESLECSTKIGKKPAIEVHDLLRPPAAMSEEQADNLLNEWIPGARDRGYRFEPKNIGRGGVRGCLWIGDQPAEIKLEFDANILWGPSLVLHDDATRKAHGNLLMDGILAWAKETGFIEARLQLLYTRSREYLSEYCRGRATKPGEEPHSERVLWHNGQAHSYFIMDLTRMMFPPPAAAPMEWSFPREAA